jgi:hypothetical protein
MWVSLDIDAFNCIVSFLSIRDNLIRIERACKSWQTNSTSQHCTFWRSICANTSNYSLNPDYWISRVPVKKLLSNLGRRVEVLVSLDIANIGDSCDLSLCADHLRELTVSSLDTTPKTLSLLAPLAQCTQLRKVSLRLMDCRHTWGGSAESPSSLSFPLPLTSSHLTSLSLSCGGYDEITMLMIKWPEEKWIQLESLTLRNAVSLPPTLPLLPRLRHFESDDCFHHDLRVIMSSPNLEKLTTAFSAVNVRVKPETAYIFPSSITELCWMKTLPPPDFMMLGRAFPNVHTLTLKNFDSSNSFAVIDDIALMPLLRSLTFIYSQKFCTPQNMHRLAKALTKVLSLTEVDNIFTLTIKHYENWSIAHYVLPRDCERIEATTKF